MIVRRTDSCVCTTRYTHTHARARETRCCTDRRTATTTAQTLFSSSVTRPSSPARAPSNPFTARLLYYTAAAVATALRAGRKEFTFGNVCALCDRGRWLRAYTLDTLNRRHPPATRVFLSYIIMSTAAAAAVPRTGRKGQSPLYSHRRRRRSRTYRKSAVQISSCNHDDHRRRRRVYIRICV